MRGIKFHLFPDPFRLLSRGRGSANTEVLASARQSRRTKWGSPRTRTRNAAAPTECWTTSRPSCVIRPPPRWRPSTSRSTAGIDAWKRLVASAPTAWAPRRELARVYKQAERWKACVETLKEGVEKAHFSSQSEKIPVLFEMVEVYRDRLKLDVMVVNAFNQILTIQPDNLQAVDALAGAVRGDGPLARADRDPAQEGGGGRRARREGRRCTCGWPTCTWRSSPTRPRPSRPSRRRWSSIPATSRRSRYLKQMYEKRRDWDKLVPLDPRRDRAASPTPTSGAAGASRWPGWPPRS